MNTTLPSIFLALLTSISAASGEFAKQLHMAIIDLDNAAFEKAPWLNTAHFLVVRSADDPAFRWIEDITGKKLAKELKEHPHVIYCGISDAEYFTSQQGKDRTILLNTESLKNRDPFSRRLTVSVAALPKGEHSIVYIQKIPEDQERLGGGSGSGMGNTNRSSVPKPNDP